MSFLLNFGIGALSAVNNNFEESRQRRQELVDARMTNLYREKQLYDQKKVKGEEERLKAEAVLSQLRGMYPDYNLTIQDAYSFQKSGQINDILDGKQKIKSVKGDVNPIDLNKQTQAAFGPDPRDAAAKDFSSAFKAALGGQSPRGVDESANALFQSSTGMSNEELQRMRLGYATELDVPTGRTYEMERVQSANMGQGSSNERNRARFVELTEIARNRQLTSAEKTDLDYLTLQASKFINGPDNITSVMNPQTMAGMGSQVGGPTASGSIYDRIEQAESGGNPYAVSPKGAVGSMQTMPGTLTDPGFGVSPASNPNDPAEQKRVGRDYFDAMMKTFGNEQDALVAYNWGPENAEAWIKAGRDPKRLPEETRNYIQKVLYGQQPTRSQAPAQAGVSAPQTRPGSAPYEEGDTYLAPVNRSPDNRVLNKTGTWALNRSTPQEIPSDIREAMNGGRTALISITNLHDNLDKAGWFKDGSLTANPIKSWIGEVTDTDVGASVWESAEADARTAIQGLIKGTPSNYDASLFEKTVPNKHNSPTKNRQLMKEFLYEANMVVRNNIDYMHQQRMQVNPEDYELADQLAAKVREVDAEIKDTDSMQKRREAEEAAAKANKNKPKGEAPAKEAQPAAPSQADVPSFSSPDDPGFKELPKGAMFMYNGKLKRKQ